MGSIRKLGSFSSSIHLLCSSSNLGYIFVYDTLKAKVGASNESIFKVDSKASFLDMLEVSGMQSFTSSKWLFILDYHKVKGLIKKYSPFFRVCDTSEFLILVKNYKEFLDVKHMLVGVNDIYLSRVSSDDVAYLFNGFGLSSKLTSFIYKSYSNEPDKIFTLRDEFRNGLKVETRKDIVSICGQSAGSVAEFALSLLNNKPSTEKGLKMVYRNRCKTAYELCDTFGVSTFRNFLVGVVKDIKDIKELYMLGVIYKDFNDIPNVEVDDGKGGKTLVYDKKRLGRLKRYLDTIKDMPYTRIVGLYLALQKSGVWRNELDMLSFIYDYYKECV